MATNATAAIAGGIDSSTSLGVAATFVVAAIPLFIYMCNIGCSSNSSRKSKKALPPWAPVGRLSCMSAFNGAELMDVMLRWSRELGFPSAYRIPLIPGSTCVLVDDPALQREILLDKDSIKPKVVYQSFETIMGKSMFSETDHDLWKPVRKGVAPAFSSAHIKRMNRVIVSQANRWIEERLERFIDNDEPFDPTKEMIDITVPIICEAAFDHRMSHDEVIAFAHELHITLTETRLRSANPLRKYMMGNSAEYRRGDEAGERLHRLCLSFLDTYRKLPSPTPGTVLSAIANNPNYKDDDARANDILVFFVAGHDTTGLALAWTLLLLAEHPEEMEKVRKALLELPESDRPACPELQNVVRESMRLRPSGALGSIRQTGRDFRCKDENSSSSSSDDATTNIIIPEGSIVFLPQLTMGRNPKVYKNPNTFRPDRWNSDEKDAEAIRMAHFPFSVGIRNCVGMALANAEIYNILAILLSNYRFLCVEPGKGRYYGTYVPEGALMKAYRV